MFGFKRRRTLARIENEMLAWVAERPSRQDQKELFVQIVKAMGFTYNQCLESFTASVMHAWTKEGKPFGQLLATELEKLHGKIEYDDPDGDGEKLAARGEFAMLLDKQKARLIDLDR